MKKKKANIQIFSETENPIFDFEKLEPLGESLLVWFEDGSIFQIQVNQNQWLRRIYSKEVHI